MKVLVTGISGRMGHAVREAVELNPGTQLAATHDVGEDADAALSKADIAIDFSFHGFTPELLRCAVAQKKPLVIGTTGHSAEEKAAITEAAKSIPIVFASNYSVGVNTLFWLTRKATRILKDYDIEIIEMHHHNKLDAPSGTARTLAEVVCEETGMDYEQDVRHGRNGLVGARPQREIGMHSLRGGDVVGDHTVMFATEGERVELTHKASSRMTFASGAVRAFAAILMNEAHRLGIGRILLTLRADNEGSRRICEQLHYLSREEDVTEADGRYCKILRYWI